MFIFILFLRNNLDGSANWGRVFFEDRFIDLLCCGAFFNSPLPEHSFGKWTSDRINTTRFQSRTKPMLDLFYGTFLHTPQWRFKNTTLYNGSSGISVLIIRYYWRFLISRPINCDLYHFDVSQRVQHKNSISTDICPLPSATSKLILSVGRLSPLHDVWVV